jgi:hypothetical protein
MMRLRTVIVTVTLTVVLPLSLLADTLYLRNGQRIQGELVEIRGSLIEFQERRGFGSPRVLRLERAEVERIDFDRYGSSWNGGGGGFGGPGGGGGGGGRPSGMRERAIVVDSTVDWTNTGIDVRPGQTVFVEASGQVRWGRDRRDGPGGERNSPFNAGRPMPNRPAAALIGRIGRDVFFIGDDRGPIQIRGGGRLELGVNDDYLPDNAGSFRVTVFY